MVAMTGNASSTMAGLTDVHLPVAIDREACPLELAPTASTTATLALGDALAMALLEIKGFSSDDFKRLHPGGNIGRRLTKVGELMHSGDNLPVVEMDTPMHQAIYEMSNKRLGITGVVDEAGNLIGCLTDGDLRRLLIDDARLLERTTGDCMHREPYRIGADELASAALHSMEEKRITSIFVCGETGELLGVVHLHDLWQLELF